MKKKNTNGFTIIELSIVIVIIGLIIAGVTAGISLVNSAKLAHTASELRKFEVAYSTFRSQYNAIPGDMKNASSYFSGVGNGNGDALIKNNLVFEHYFVWQHLSSAGLIPGSYTNLGSVQAYLNHPASDFGVFGVISDPIFQGKVRNKLAIAKTNNSDCSWCNSSMTPIDAKNLDVKMDDGMASKGRLLGVDGGNNAGSCSAVWNAAPGSNYKVNSIIACRMFYLIQ